MSLIQGAINQYEQANQLNNFWDSYYNLSDEEYEKKYNELWNIHRGTPQGERLQADYYEGLLKRRSGQLNDPRSQYYQNFQQMIRDNLNKVYSTDKLIAGNRSRGISMAGSGIIAQRQREALEGRVNETAANAANQLYYSNTGQVNDLLKQVIQSRFTSRGLAQQEDQFNKQQNDWTDYLGSGLAYAGGFLIGGPAGGAAAGSTYEGIK
jgi:hypothetical protein